jgi:nucleoside 2-deoxyribosyltransferase
MSKIYLAGGMYGDWREEVRSAMNADFFDPCDHWLDTLEEYGAWDLYHVAQSDICFTYIERDNPSCIGAAVETGYAAAGNTLVICVIERDHIHHEDGKVAFLQAASDVTFRELDAGIEYLQHYA